MERMGRSRTDRARSRALAPLSAVPLVLTAVGLSGCGDHPAAATENTAVRDAVVVAADGTTSAAHVGQRLRSGESLRTAAAALAAAGRPAKPGGAAILSTGGRQSYVGADTLYSVRSDGAELRRGAVIVDARRGPRASYDVGITSVALPKGSVVRIERTAAVRVGVLVGSVDLRSDDGGRLAVDRYHQAVIVGRVLPARATALTLTDDPAERQVVPDLVADDVALQGAARALDTSPDGAAIVAAATRIGYVAPASLSSGATVTNAVATTPQPSEVALPVAIARAARGTDATAVAQATRVALGLRKEKGSWGVVARLVGTTSGGVSNALDALLGTTPSGGPVGPVGGQPGGGPVITLPGGGSGGSGTPSSNPTPRPSSGSPRPTATPSPSSSPGVVEQVEDVVGRLTPSPLPSLPAAPLLGGLLNP
jgi:hypothetical protein